ncbi:MAG: 30S ribosomal protein S8 [Deltaproteobacteria bacterium]|jgi:small subunit ribosomal protein S8|nr:30S ribosomal protein S8 [Deltaproteobacteria bacterium]
MSMSDPIADMLTRIRNAGRAKMKSVDIPGSMIKTNMAKVLKDQGYIKNYKFINDDKQGLVRVYLKYDDKNIHAIYGIQRASKPSLRNYVKCKDIRPVLNGLGIAILSTSKGVMTDKQAKKENVGGEILCNVW